MRIAKKYMNKTVESFVSSLGLFEISLLIFISLLIDVMDDQLLSFMSLTFAVLPVR